VAGSVPPQIAQGFGGAFGTFSRSHALRFSQQSQRSTCLPLPFVLKSTKPGHPFTAHLMRVAEETVMITAPPSR
jgi:hypothetical protein